MLPGKSFLLAILGLAVACTPSPSPGLQDSIDFVPAGPPVEPAPRGVLRAARRVIPLGERVLLGDCDGDGRLEVFGPYAGRVFRHLADGSFAEIGRPRLEVEHSEATPGGTGPDLRAPAYPGAFVDLDGDGVGDLVSAQARAVHLLRGRGGCEFGSPVALFRPCRALSPQQLNPVDLDLDGQVDFVAACSGPDDPPFVAHLARGGGSYEMVELPILALGKRAVEVEPRPTGYPTFGSLIDDFDGDGALDGFFLVDSNFGWFAWGTDPDRPLDFVRDDQVTESIASTDVMGISPIDFDRDGRIDYFGSGTPESRNRLLWHRGARSLVDVAFAAGVHGSAACEYWSTLAADLDVDGWTDLVVTCAGASKDLDRFRAPTIYFSRRNGTFADVTARVFDGEPPPFDAEMMTCGDLDGDGQIACFVPSVNDREQLLVRSGIDPVGGWVGLRLRGTVSAPNASGARVSLEGEERPLVVIVGGQAPTAGLHDDAVLLATGSRSVADVTITWPSGLVQQVNGLTAGQYHAVVEPRAVLLSHRVARADGSASVEVQIDPCAADASTGSIERRGAGEWAGPAIGGADGLIRRALRAPRTPGAARIEVSFDGRPLRVRPRVEFR